MSAFFRGAFEERPLRVCARVPTRHRRPPSDVTRHRRALTDLASHSLARPPRSASRGQRGGGEGPTEPPAPAPPLPSPAPARALETAAEQSPRGRQALWTAREIDPPFSHGNQSPPPSLTGAPRAGGGTHSESENTSSLASRRTGERAQRESGGELNTPRDPDLKYINYRSSRDRTIRVITVGNSRSSESSFATARLNR
ncbi:hypothetical protein AAFF_G00267300 [Aldrovandia affinis]|uniref:Uncharacterized protein n=1 Tax=Aldrovandia affinis TaxID=143900 RepID=A0AAD7RBE6_9TELE|nr:hypothetical protein AAFF_G00267300 [Aldrovandia affinis]